MLPRPLNHLALCLMPHSLPHVPSYPGNVQIVVNLLGAVSAMGHVLRTEVLQAVERLVAARLPGAAAGPAGGPRHVVESFGCLELVEMCMVSGAGAVR